MLAYPNRSHSVSEGKHTSWHLRDLLTRVLDTHLPAHGQARDPLRHNDDAASLTTAELPDDDARTGGSVRTKPTEVCGR